MVVNFKVREISRGPCKLVRTPTLIIIKKLINHPTILPILLVITFVCNSWNLHPSCSLNELCTNSPIVESKIIINSLKKKKKKRGAFLYVLIFRFLLKLIVSRMKVWLMNNLTVDFMLVRVMKNKYLYVQ
jgi:hypothetical protein